MRTKNYVHLRIFGRRTAQIRLVLLYVVFDTTPLQDGKSKLLHAGIGGACHRSAPPRHFARALVLVLTAAVLGADETYSVIAEMTDRLRIIAIVGHGETVAMSMLGGSPLLRQPAAANFR